MAARVLPLNPTTTSLVDDWGSDPAAWEMATDSTDYPGTSTGAVLSWDKTTVHTTPLTLALDGGSVDEDYFRAIVASTGNQGTPTSGARIEVTASLANAVCVTINEDHFSLVGMGIKAVATASAADIYAIGVLSQSYTGVKVVNNCVYNTSNTGSTTKSHSMGIYLGYYAGKTYYCIGNAVINTTGGASDPFSAGILFAAFNGAVTVHAYSNTVNTSNRYGVLAATFGLSGNITVNLKNTIAQDCTAGTISSSGPGTETINQTTNQISGVTFAVDGYNLGGATNNGTSLNPDPDGWWNVTTDINGDPYASTPSIGCDQWVDTGNRRRRSIICGGSI